MRRRYLGRAVAAALACLLLTTPSPAQFPLGSQESAFVPDDLILRHESLGKFCGPRAERQAGSDVADISALHAGESLQVRTIPSESGILVRRFSVREPDCPAADILMEVAHQVERDP